MNSPITFPFHTWSMSKSTICSLLNNIDCSYSGSRIDQTYICFSNESDNNDLATNRDAVYELECAD